MATKLSISLPDADVAFLDELDRNSRSAAVQAAIKLARSVRIVDDYTAAYDEWVSSGEAEVWDGVVGDGIADEADQ
ncbi:CopG family transcriptional regulator [Catenulispora acidiphila DSM 44928]|uniref:CopG family transcriptional regulator n=1 Tax=Catenulispora acidiphila (strain DSM 44928 / JCM 14897 / NBRC 102108 / NRRL B-24433 / ID139908) TaxID=479433 RepID=C7Q8D3_CATAD|nr:antitoxin [Catenulispora acidiphila]ACU76121.1 CopG family transcriptional regulator [Catenulispora acidiphila DSM 44928]